MEFGECSTNKVVQFAKLYDINGVLTDVPYQSVNESILLLFKYYLEITSCKEKINNQ